MVYVKPTEFKTKEKYPVPLNRFDSVATTNSDSYIKAILPQVRDLVTALGLTKEDLLAIY